MDKSKSMLAEIKDKLHELPDGGVTLNEKILKDKMRPLEIKHEEKTEKILKDKDFIPHKEIKERETKVRIKKKSI